MLENTMRDGYQWMRGRRGPADLDPWNPTDMATITKIHVLPDGLFSIADMSRFALSEAELRDELRRRGNAQMIVDDLVYNLKRLAVPYVNC
jgi:hypothetical protein